MPPARSFDSLLRAARSGDRGARGELMARCEPQLLAFARKKIADKLQAKADPNDLVQDTFKEALDVFDRFIGLSEDLFLRWMTRILRNNISDLGRRYKARPRDTACEQRLDTPMRQLLVDNELTPASGAVRHEQLIDLHLALERLSPEDREVLKLRNDLGLPFADIARRMGKPTADSARKLFDRALERLEGLMGQHHSR